MDAQSVDLSGQGRGGEACLIAISHCCLSTCPLCGQLKLETNKPEEKLYSFDLNSDRAFGLQ